MTDAIMKALDSVEAKFHSYTIEQRVLADRMMRLEQSGSAMDVDVSYGPQTLGATVAKQFAGNIDAFQKHKNLSLKVETKSIASTAVGARASIAPTQGSDVMVQTQLMPKLRMQSSSGVASMIYGRRSVAITGGAGTVGENVSRPLSEPVFVSTTQNIVTVSGHAVLSETAIRTTSELEAVINLHLASDVFRAADAMLINGGTNFTGGLLALATPDVLAAASTNDLLEETIAIGAMSMRATGYQPDIVVVNPTDWRGVYLRREVGGLYIHASPLMPAPLVISGLAVVFSSSVATKQAMLIDSRYVDFMPNEAMRIEFNHVASQFLTGEITVRAELQGIPVVRDLAALKIMSRA